MKNALSAVVEVPYISEASASYEQTSVSLRLGPEEAKALNRIRLGMSAAAGVEFDSATALRHILREASKDMLPPEPPAPPALEVSPADEPAEPTEAEVAEVAPIAAAELPSAFDGE